MLQHGERFQPLIKQLWGESERDCRHLNNNWAVIQVMPNSNKLSHGLVGIHSGQMHFRLSCSNDISGYHGQSSGNIRATHFGSN